MTRDLALRRSLCSDRVHPAFWKLDSREQLAEQAAREPRWFWDTMLDSIASAGIQDIEITFPPGDYATAIAAYGRPRNSTRRCDVAGRRQRLLRRPGGTRRARRRSGGGPGQRPALLGVPGRDRGEVPGDGTAHAQDAHDRPASFVDLAAAAPIADLVNQLGAVAQESGIQAALHTESHSVFWTPATSTCSCCSPTRCTWRCARTPATSPSAGPTRCASWTGTGTAGHRALEGRRRARAARTAHRRGHLRAPGRLLPAHRDRRGRLVWRSRLLQEIGYTGCTLLELDAAEDPVFEMTQARDFVTTALSRFYTAAS